MGWWAPADETCLPQQMILTFRQRSAGLAEMVPAPSSFLRQLSVAQKQVFCLVQSCCKWPLTTGSDHLRDAQVLDVLVLLKHSQGSVTPLSSHALGAPRSCRHAVQSDAVWCNPVESGLCMGRDAVSHAAQGHLPILQCMAY